VDQLLDLIDVAIEQFFVVGVVQCKVSKNDELLEQTKAFMCLVFGLGQEEEARECFGQVSKPWKELVKDFC